MEGRAERGGGSQVVASAARRRHWRALGHQRGFWREAGGTPSVARWGTNAGAGGKEAMCIEFGKRGSLAKAQQAKHGGPLCKEALKVLNGAFPTNMVDATDPNYERELWKKLPLN